MSSRLSRRALLRGLAAAGGAAVGSRIAGPWLPNAFAAGEKSAVVVIHFVGGYNSVFCSPDSFLGTGAFLANNGNVRPLQNGLFVDKATLGSLPQVALDRMATIGNRHGSTDHGQACVQLWSDGTNNYSIRLAAAMGGAAPIKCAQISGSGVDTPSPAINGVSIQGIGDMGSLIETLVGGDPRSPDRGIAAKALVASQSMARRTLDRNPKAGLSLTNGFSASVDALKKLPPPFDYRSLPNIYGTGLTLNDSFESKLCAAELLIRAGTNVVNIFSANDWDTHSAQTGGRTDGSVERSRMESTVIPPLQKFLSRVHDQNGLGGTHNVVTVMIGDFARSLPNNDHAANLSATVIGKYVKVGTTGRVSSNVSLPAGTGGSNEMWAYIAAVAKAPGQPFGGNPHPLVL